MLHLDARGGVWATKLLSICCNLQYPTLIFFGRSGVGPRNTASQAYKQAFSSPIEFTNPRNPSIGHQTQEANLEHAGTQNPADSKIFKRLKSEQRPGRIVERLKDPPVLL